MEEGGWVRIQRDRGRIRLLLIGRRWATLKPAGVPLRSDCIIVGMNRAIAIRLNMVDSLHIENII